MATWKGLSSSWMVQIVTHLSMQKVAKFEEKSYIYYSFQEITIFSPFIDRFLLMWWGLSVFNASLNNTTRFILHDINILSHPDGNFKRFIVNGQTTIYIQIKRPSGNSSCFNTNTIAV